MALRTFFALLSVVLVMVLAFQSPLHAVTPHSHSHSHSSEEVSALWASFHAALRSEEKQILLAVVGAVSSVLFSVLIFNLGFSGFALHLVRVTRDRPQQLLDSLRNGSLPYRRFV